MFVSCTRYARVIVCPQLVVVDDEVFASKCLDLAL